MNRYSLKVYLKNSNSIPTFGTSPKCCEDELSGGVSIHQKEFILPKMQVVDSMARGLVIPLIDDFFLKKKYSEDGLCSAEITFASFFLKPPNNNF